MRKIKYTIFSTVLLLFGTSIFADTTLADREAEIKALIKKYDCGRYTRDLEKNTLCPLYQKVWLLPKKLNEPEDVWQKEKLDKEAAFIGWLEDEARIRNKIKPKIGMSVDYIYRHVMGPPDSINETETSSGKTIQLVYEDGDKRSYFYFNERGILTTIQRSR